VKKSYSKTFKV